MQSASLSLDLDNQWSYMKTHGDAGWESFPTYLDIVIPRFLDVFRQLDLKITVMVVGQDAEVAQGRFGVAEVSIVGSGQLQVELGAASAVEVGLPSFVRGLPSENRELALGGSNPAVGAPCRE